MAALAVLGLLVLFAIGIPLGLAFVLLGLLALNTQGVAFTAAPQRMIFGLDSFTLLAVPLFLLAGNLMNVSGVTTRIYEFAAALVGHWRAGLAHVNVLGSVIFAGMSGSALADAAGLGTIEIKAMTDEGYEPEFAAAVTAASATIGPIIPPSIAFVLYALIAEVSVGRLFLAGFIPGLLMAASMMILIAIMARRRNYPSHTRATCGQVVRLSLRAVFPLLTPVILIGGMMTGVFTATEAAGVSVAYAILLGAVIYREMTLMDMVRAFRDTAITTGAIMIIVAGATFLAWVLARFQVTQQVAAAVVSMSGNTVVLLLLLNIVLLIMGMFIDTTGVLLIVTPVIVPVAKAAGIDLVHFGVLMTINLMIGLLTPPVGMALFVVSQVAKRPLAVIARATAPFIVPLVIVLLMVTYWPDMVLFLPNLVLGPSKGGF